MLDHFNIYGNDLVGKLHVSNNQRYYYLKDHLGSIRVTLDQSGNIDSWTDYYPFGKEARGSNTVNEPREGFTGHQHDAEIGLEYMGARYYNSNTAIFMSIDPLHQFATPYVYVGNNPIVLIDPSGMAAAGVLLTRDALIRTRKAIPLDLRINGVGPSIRTISNVTRYGGTAVTGLGLILTTSEMFDGNVSTLRKSYHAAGFALSWSVATYSAYGGPAGLGVGIWAANIEITYDSGRWLAEKWVEISVKYERAFKNGWFFGRKP